MTTLGQNIRYLRHQANQTQAQFAARIGAKKDMISDIEIGREKRPCQKRYELAAHLGYDLDYLSTFSILPPDPQPERNARADEIEAQLVTYGHCVETKCRFISPF